LAAVADEIARLNEELNLTELLLKLLSSDTLNVKIITQDF
jgi:hypothetical protein